MASSDIAEHDVFLSFSATDRQWVNDQLQPRLRAAGIRVVDQDHFVPGKPRLNEIEKAIRHSRYTLLVLSPAYLRDTWQQFASVLASSYGLDTGQWRVIPAIMDECEVPPRLNALVKIDLRSEDDWTRLIDTLKPEAANRSAVPPPPAVTENRTDSRTNVALNGIIGLVIGIAASLIASWLLQDVLRNSFSGAAFIFIALLIAACLLGSIWTAKRSKPIGLGALVCGLAAIAVVIVAAVSLRAPSLTPNSHAPIIQKVLASPSTVHVGQTATLTVVATDPDNDNLVFYWKAQKGSVPPGAQGDIVTYTAPNASGIDTIEVTVSDGQSSVSQAIRVSVLNQ